MCEFYWGFWEKLYWMGEGERERGEREIRIGELIECFSF